MKIFGPNFQVYSFLYNRISAKLFDYSKKITITPQYILCLNISEFILESLRNAYPDATIRSIRFADLTRSHLPSDIQTIDLLLANISAANQQFDLSALLEDANRVMNPEGQCVFATWDHEGKLILERYTNQLKNHEILDEKHALAELNDIENFKFISFKERLFKLASSNEPIDCHIFVIYPQEILTNTLAPTFEINPTESEVETAKNDSEFSDVNDDVNFETEDKENREGIPTNGVAVDRETESKIIFDADENKLLNVSSNLSQENHELMQVESESNNEGIDNDPEIKVNDAESMTARENELLTNHHLEDDFEPAPTDTGKNEGTEENYRATETVNNNEYKTESAEENSKIEIDFVQTIEVTDELNLHEGDDTTGTAAENDSSANDEDIRDAIEKEVDTNDAVFEEVTNANDSINAEDTHDNKNDVENEISVNEECDDDVDDKENDVEEAKTEDFSSVKNEADHENTSDVEASRVDKESIPVDDEGDDDNNEDEDEKEDEDLKEDICDELVTKNDIYDEFIVSNKDINDENTWDNVTSNEEYDDDIDDKENNVEEAITEDFSSVKNEDDHENTSDVEASHEDKESIPVDDEWDDDDDEDENEDEDENLKENICDEAVTKNDISDVYEFIVSNENVNDENTRDNVNAVDNENSSDEEYDDGDDNDEEEDEENINDDIFDNAVTKDDISEESTDGNGNVKDEITQDNTNALSLSDEEYDDGDDDDEEEDENDEKEETEDFCSVITETDSENSTVVETSSEAQEWIDVDDEEEHDDDDNENDEEENEGDTTIECEVEIKEVGTDEEGESEHSIEDELPISTESANDAIIEDKEIVDEEPEIINRRLSK